MQGNLMRTLKHPLSVLPRREIYIPENCEADELAKSRTVLIMANSAHSTICLNTALPGKLPAQIGL